MNSIIERINIVCKKVRLLNSEPVTFKKLVNSTRRQFKHFDFDIKIRLQKEKTFSDTEFCVMAFYDSDDDFENETPIEVVIHHNLPPDELFPPHAVTAFLIQIYDAVAHEYRHQQQSIKRNHESYWDHPGLENYQAYLSDPDEIDAYAFSIAIELLRFMPKERVKKYMPKIYTLGKMRNGLSYVSPNLQSYLSHFRNSQMIRRIAKKIYYHVENIDTRHIFQ